MLDMAAEMDTGLKGSVIYNPLDPTDRVDAVLEFQPGKPLSHYVNDLPSDIEWQIMLNTAVIPATGLDLTFPKMGDHIIAVPVPEGGGDDGKAILALVATIALSFFAPIAGTKIAAAFFGGSKLAATLAGAAVSIAGGLLINAMIPAPEDGSGTKSNAYGIDGPKNTSSEGIPYPVLYGEHGFGGNLGDLYTINTTDENGEAIQYLYGRVIVSEGPIQSIDTIYINDQPIENYEDVEFDYRLGDAVQDSSPWFENTITLQNDGRELTTNWQTYTTSQAVDKLRIDFVAPAGLGTTDDKGRDVTVTVNIEAEYSPTGQNDWRPIYAVGNWYTPASPADETNGFRIQRTVGTVAEDPGGAQTTPYNETIEYRVTGSSDPWVSMGTKSGTTAGRVSLSWEVSGLPLASYEFRVNGVVTANPGLVWHIGQGPITMSDTRAVTLRRSYHTDLLEQQVYDVRFRRTNAKTLNEGWREDVNCSDIGEILVEPLNLPYVSWLGFKVRVDGQINGLPTITGVAKGRIVPIYDHAGTLVSVSYSRNPADIVLDMYLNSRYGGAIEKERIDFAGFSEWRDFCTDNGLTFDGIYYETSNIDDATKPVFTAGRAQRVTSGARISVAMDRPDTPVMLFSAGNILKNSFALNYLPFQDRINDIEVAYNDKTDKYKRKVVRISNNAALNRGEPLKSATIELKGITDKDRAAKEAQFRMNYNQLVYRTTEWESPIEAISCTVGDVVLVQHEMMDWGIGGRVLPGATVNSVKLDREITFKWGTTYKLLVHHDSKSLVTSATVTSHTGTVVTLNTAITDDHPSSLTVNGTGDEYLILRKVDDTTFVLDDSSAGQALNLVGAVTVRKHDAIEEVTVINPSSGADVTTDTVTMSAGNQFAQAPGDYVNFIFGASTAVNKPYRVKTLRRIHKTNRVKITAIEYVEAVYSDTPSVPAVTSPTRQFSQHVGNLSAVEQLRIVNGGYVSYVLASWTPGTEIYAGAQVQVSINNSAFRTVETTQNTSAAFQVTEGDAVVVRVVALDFNTGEPLNASGAPSVSLTATGDVTAPEIPSALVATPLVDGYALSWNAQTEADLHHFDIYVANTSTPAPNASTPATHTSLTNTFSRTDVGSGLTRHFWVRAVDAAGNASAWSSRVSTTTLTYETSRPAAAVPTGLNLSSTLSENGLSTLSATWNVASGATGYEVGVTASGGSEIVFNVNSTNWSTLSQRGVSYSIRVRSINLFNEPSAWTAAVNITSATDNIPPAVPTGLAVFPGFGTIWAGWDANAEPDFDHYDVYYTTTATVPNAGTAPSLSTPAREISITGWDANQTVNVFVRAVDTSGNKSAWSAKVSGTTPVEEAITAADIEGIVDATSFATGVSPVGVVSSLPADNSDYDVVVLTTNGKLYRWNGSAWTAAVPTTDLSGTITNAQIAAVDAAKITSGVINAARINAVNASAIQGQIIAGQIASAAIDASKFASTVKPIEIVATLPGAPHVQGRTVLLTTDNKLYRNTGSGWIASVAAGDVSGQLVDAQLAAISSAKLVGQVVSAQIASIDAAKLTGTIEEARLASIAASKVTGQLTNSQIADLAAAKLTGTISAPQIADGAVTDAKISGLAASKVTGQLTDAQIADLDAAKLSGQVVAGQLAAGASLLDQPVFTMDEGMAHTLTASNGVVSYDASTKYSGTHSANISYTGASDPHGTGSTGAPYIAIPDLVALRMGGKRIRVSGFARQPSSNAASEFGVCYSTADNGNSGFARFTPTTSWQEFSFTYDVPTPISGGGDYLGFWGDTSNSGKSTLFDQWSIEIVEDLSLSPGQIVETQISDDAISTPKLQAGAVTANVIASNAVVADKIAAGAIVAGKIAAGAITAAAIAAGAITATEIASGAITTAKIAANAVTADKIAANAITAAKIAAGAITAGKIAAGTIVAADIAAGAITAGKIAANAVTATEIASNAITSVKIASGAITTAKLAANAVTANEIAANAITSAKINAGAITTAKLAAGAVTANEIAALAVTAGKVAANAITATEIAANAVTAGKIAANAVTATAIAADAVTADKIAARSVSASKLTISDSENLVWNASFDGDAAEWSFSGTNFYQTATKKYGAGAIRCPETGGNSHAIRNNHYVPCEPGENFYLSGYIRVGAGYSNASGTGVGIRASWRDLSEVEISTSIADSMLSPAIDTWHFFEGEVTAPAGAVYVNFEFFSYSQTGGNSYFDGAYMRRMDAGRLIVDGTLEATKLVANSITGGQIEAGAIGATEIAADAIQAKHLAITDFENYTAGSSGEWANHPFTLYSGGRVTPVTGHDSAGGSALRLDTAGSTTKALLNSIIEVSGTSRELYVDFWVYNAATGGSVENTKLRFGDDDDGNSVVDAVDFFGLPSGQWTHVTETLTIPAGTTRLKLNVNADHTGGYYLLDDISIRRKQAGELIVDGTITGTHIAAATITASNLTIGNRNVDFDGLNFTTNGNTLSWDSGSVRYRDNGGNYQYRAVSAGSVAYSGSTQFIYWQAGGPSLSTTTTSSTAVGDYSILVAVYYGGTNFVATKGRTIIDGDYIKTGTIDTDHLKAGAITTEKLSVVSSGNLLDNSNWAAGLANNHYSGGNDAAMNAQCSVRLCKDGIWGPVVGGTLEIKQVGEAGAETAYYTANLYALNDADTIVDGRGIHIEPNGWYELSAQAGAHRCYGRLHIFWYDVTGAYIGENSVATATNVSGGSKAWEEWPRYRIKAQAPANARFAAIGFRKYRTTTGASPVSSYLFVHKPMFARTTAEATEGVPYAPSGSTYITGNEILTGAITAGHIKAGEINTNHMNAGTIDADRLKVNSIEAAQIAAGAIGASEIASDAITAKHLTVTDFTNLAANSAGEWKDHPWDLTGDADIVTLGSGPDGAGGKAMRLKNTGSSIKAYLNHKIGLPNTEDIVANPLATKKLYYSFWVYNNGATGQTSDNTKVRFSNADTTAHIVDVAFHTAPNGQWTQYTGTLEFDKTVNLIDVQIRSNQTVGDFKIDDIILRRMFGGELIVTGSIKSNHLVTDTAVITNSAQIAGLVVTDAHIDTVSADKISVAALDPAITVGPGGTTIGTVDDRAQVNSPYAGIQINTITFGSPGSSDGEAYIHGFDADGNPADVNGFILHQGTRLNLKGRCPGSGGVGTFWIGAKTDGSVYAGTDNYPYTLLREDPNTAGSWQWLNQNTWTALTGTPLTLTRAIGEVTSSGSEYITDAFLYTSTKPLAECLLASQINRSTTRIEPGKITISGGTTLNDWRAANKTTIDGGKIEADSITATQIAAGSITAEHLTIGGHNAILNSDASDGTKNVSLSGTGAVYTGASISVEAAGTPWAGLYENAFELQAPADNATNGYADMRFHPEGTIAGYSIQPGAWYEWSAQSTYHRCQVRMKIAWFTSAGAWISETDFGLVDSGTGIAGGTGEPGAENWTRYGGVAQAPANAYYARPFVRLDATNSTTAGYVFVFRPTFRESSSGAGFSPYVRGGITRIDGDSITTGTLNASKLVLDGVTLYNNGGQLGVKNGGIDTAQVANNAISITRVSGGTGNQSVSWTVAADCEIAVMAFFDLYVEGATAKTGYARIYRDSAIISAQALSKNDTSPTTTSEQRFVTLVTRTTRTSGQSVTIHAKLEGDAFTNRAVSLLIIERFK